MYVHRYLYWYFYRKDLQYYYFVLMNMRIEKCKKYYDSFIYAKIRCTYSVFSVLDDKREDTITKINSKLPPCIKIQAIRKVTKNFNCKSACDSRTYLYLIPTFAFAPVLPLNELKSPEEEVSPEMYQVRLVSRNFF